MLHKTALKLISQNYLEVLFEAFGSVSFSKTNYFPDRFLEEITQ